MQETHFFRNAPQMEALRRRVLPDLLRRAAGREGRPLTIWSAGCSTGEEPYTLAMLLLELAPAVGRARWPVRIVATDVSAARAAGRPPRDVRRSHPRRSRRRRRATAWFEPSAGGSLAVAEPVRRLVDLQLHNLVTDPAPFAPGEVDLVVCRNVTIYFDRPTTRALVGRFHGVLAEGGYLLLGHSETLWQVSDDFALVPVGDAFVYRRSHDARPGAPRRRRLAVRAPVSSARERPAGPAAAARPAAVRRDAAQPAPASAALDLLSRARQRIDAGDYPGAASAAEAAVQVDPLLAPAYVVLGRARTSVGQDADAVGPLRKAVYLDARRGGRALPARRRARPAGSARRCCRRVPGGRRDARPAGLRHVGRPVRRPRPGRARRPLPAARRAVVGRRARRCASHRRGCVMSGWVTFVMAGRELAGGARRGPRGRARHRCRGAAGSRAPVTGLLELRGTPVPVVDLRTAADPEGCGDVLVLGTADGLLGLAVDKVLAVVGQDDLLPLPPAAPRSAGLPPYVLEVRHDPAGRPVLVVSLRALAGLVPA